MNKELVKIALSKGFKAKTLTTSLIDNSVLYPNKCPQVSNPLIYELWLYELSKWVKKVDHKELYENFRKELIKLGLTLHLLEG